MLYAATATLYKARPSKCGTQGGKEAVPTHRSFKCCHSTSAAAFMRCTAYVPDQMNGTSSRLKASNCFLMPDLREKSSTSSIYSWALWILSSCVYIYSRGGRRGGEGKMGDQLGTVSHSPYRIIITVLIISYAECTLIECSASIYVYYMQPLTAVYV